MHPFRLGAARPAAALLVLAALAAAPLQAQDLAAVIDTSGTGSGPSAQPFGLAAEPGSGRLFVAIAGSLSSPNDAVAIVDPALDQVVGEIQVGLFPEEIAFLTDAQGRAVIGAVTNSTSGSVTLWDAATDQVLGEVPLPDPFGFGSFPFGICANETGDGFYVTTLDGSGSIHAVDATALAVDAARSLTAGFGSNGRLALVAGRLFLPGANFFKGAETGLEVLDLTTGAATEHYVVQDRLGEWAWPTAQEILPLPDGRLALGGTGFDGRIFLTDADGRLLRTLRAEGTGGDSHGLGVSEDGSLLAVCDLLGNQLVLFDLLNEVEISRVDLFALGGWREPNDALFLGGRLYVTVQAQEAVLVFENLPVPQPGNGFFGDLVLDPPDPPAGGTVHVDLQGAGPVALVAATGDQPVTVQGVDLGIGPSPVLLATGQDSLSLDLALPAFLQRGDLVWVQGVSDPLGNPRTTAPRVLAVQ